MRTFQIHRLPWSSRGFSLVEMLVVISVIGVVAAIAIPNLGKMSAAAQVATNQRNAQSIVGTYSSGAAAGVLWTGSNRAAKVQAVVMGDSPSTGVFTGKEFKVPNLSVEDQKASYPYVGYDLSGDLYYDKAGGQSPN